jgi:hypothetical protein
MQVLKMSPGDVLYKNTDYVKFLNDKRIIHLQLFILISEFWFGCLQLVKSFVVSSSPPHTTSSDNQCVRPLRLDLRRPQVSFVRRETLKISSSVDPVVVTTAQSGLSSSISQVQTKPKLSVKG